jgi:methyltransferase (TIGR00027 family)
MTVRNVSDTARWVAWYRAEETDRPDALFRDPLARRLAGERGRDIVRSLPGARSMGWVMVVRTCIFDSLIQQAVADGIDTVLNLAAGFDARPYRLPLPTGLRWIEVDLPLLLEEKRAALVGEFPRCHLESVPLDLGDAAGRAALFARVGAASRRTLVLSEGLLAYLEPGAVLDLARALHAQPSFEAWCTDLTSPFILQRYMRRANARLRDAGTPLKFAPEEGEAFFRQAGWVGEQFLTIAEESHRLGREMRGAWIFKLLYRLSSASRRAEMARRYRSGVVRLRRA